MSTSPEPTFDFVNLRSKWGWFLALGVILVLVGGVALAHPLMASLATIFTFGILLIVSGAAELVFAFQMRERSSIALNLLSGVLEIVVGLLMFKLPGTSLKAATMLFTVWLLVGGAFRMVAAFALRVPGAMWIALSGSISVLLGVMLINDWPDSAEWVVGTIVGVDLIFQGVSWIVLAFTLRRGTPAIA